MHIQILYFCEKIVLWFMHIKFLRLRTKLFSGIDANSLQMLAKLHCCSASLQLHAGKTQNHLLCQLDMRIQGWTQEWENGDSV